MKLSQIYEGWRNKLLPPAALRELIQTTSLERILICNECPLHSRHHNTPIRPDDHCTDCGCNLDAKTKCLSCDCPKGKWMGLVSLKEEQKMLKGYGKEEQQNNNASKNSNKKLNGNIK
jgi:hypothetical protein